jgi:hypothetical protein
MAKFASATDYAIRLAAREGHLVLREREGRFGSYVSIEDKFGLIEVADDMAAATKRVEDCK